jgi:hypothetical protein
VQEKRKLWKENIKILPINNLVFLDESSVNLAYFRLYGWGTKSERVRCGVRKLNVALKMCNLKGTQFCLQLD